jgi:Sigma-70, region 4
MAVVLGLVHTSRGNRNALLWHGAGDGSNEHSGVRDLLPFRRLRDLLQYYRGSLIGAPDVLRDVCLTNRREGLGALKVLHVLGCVEIGKLDPQTVAWRWVAGRGQSRTYQRGYFKGESEPIEFKDEAVREAGTGRWPWIHEIIHKEWLLQAQADGFGEIAETDGSRRYRPTSPANRLFGTVLSDALQQMPERMKDALVATLLRGWGQEEAAELLGISVSTLRRDTEAGLARLRCFLTEAGFAPVDR